MPGRNLRCSLLVPLLLLCAAAVVRSDDSFPLKAKRILFLGDSITHAGGYVASIETQLRLAGVEPLPEFINVGLGSETCSGLSEPGHPFPRPDVHERLERALDAIKPDVVVACYGMNDGIYYPFGEKRFAAYRDGVNRLIEKVHAADARVILLTPPPFDRVPVEPKGKLKPVGEEIYGYTGMYEGYNDVLARYAEWIMQQQDRVAMTVDVHSAFMDQLREHRMDDPNFTMSPDGIHPNAAGHRVIAEAVLAAWGVEPVDVADAEFLKLVHQKTRIIHDAWLTHIGHQHPRVGKGLPLEEAEAKADELESRIAAYLADVGQ